MPSSDLPVDVLTKPLPRDRFVKLFSYLGVILQRSSSGSVS
jgi:hypothetical protein